MEMKRNQELKSEKVTSKDQSSFLMTLLALLLACPAQAGVFNTPHFVNLGEFAIGVEPELILDSDQSSGASTGVNLRYTHGISELNNVTAIVGTGGKDRRLRLGGNYTFDIFPDLEGQPGIGLALQGLFVNRSTAGSIELTGIPYIHKAISTDHGVIEPFLSIPIGIALSDGRYQTISTVAVGALLEHSAHFRSVFEFGVAMSHAQTYISGGLVYYH